MNKKDRVIMVVKRDLLFDKDKDWFEGFRTTGIVDYERRILDRREYQIRSAVEENPSYKQPIGYALVFNPLLKQVFVYQRALKDADYSEKRLQGKVSLGVGGHIERPDEMDGNPISASTLREVREEVQMDNISDMSLLGYVNDDRDAVGRVHFGLLYLIETGSSEVKTKGVELRRGQLEPIERLEEILCSPDVVVESWSRIALDALKARLR